MLKKPVKRLLIAFCVLVILILPGWILVREISTQNAEEHARDIIEIAYRNYPSSTAEEKIVAITRQVFENSEHADIAQSSILRIRPYLTNHRLPSSLRLPDCVIETNIGKGLCDHAGRMLSFLLKLEGFRSVQWNMVTETSAHSAVLVTMPDRRQILVDPFFGYVAVNENGHLIHPREAQQLVLSGEPAEKVFLALGRNSISGFYDQAGSISMAAEGDALILEATLPRTQGKAVFLGDIDGNENDVMAAARGHKMSPYWQYMGHKYDREWVRVLSATQPVRLVITLTDDVEKGILTSTPEPVVDGKTLSWDLRAGDKITFRDGLAKISWKRMNSYIAVDRIALYPANGGVREN